MRIVGFLIVMMAAAITAGCAPRPVAYMSYPAPAPSAGIDNVVYGSGPPGAPPAMNMAYNHPPYAPPPAVLGPPAPGPMIAPAPGPVIAAPAAYRAPVYAPAPVPVAPMARVASVAPVVPVGPLAFASPDANPGEYTLDSGDRLRIVVFGQEGLTNAYAVDASGFIDMPLIGPVLARGATTSELAAAISAKLRDGFIREPHVAVEIESYRPFFILGEVTQPGQYPYVANMTAETAVAIAGGFTPRAFRRNLVLNRMINGRAMRMAVPLTFPLRPGDTVNVQERWF